MHFLATGKNTQRVKCMRGFLTCLGMLLRPPKLLKCIYDHLILLNDTLVVHTELSVQMDVFSDVALPPCIEHGWGLMRVLTIPNYSTYNTSNTRNFSLALAHLSPNLFPSLQFKGVALVSSSLPYPPTLKLFACPLNRALLSQICMGPSFPLSFAQNAV